MSKDLSSTGGSDMKILLIDIETAPNLGYTWGKWEQNVIENKYDWYILCFAAKWHGDKDIIFRSIADVPAFKKNKRDDRYVVRELWKLMHDADVIVAHNGQAFDVRKIKTRFLIHGMKPTSPFKVVDTKRVAKAIFKFDSNKLDELGRQLGVGRKHVHTGFDLWLRCMNGEKKAWKEMETYNIRDVILLEEIYDKLLGWMTNHPNHNLYDGTRGNCPNCGSVRLQSRGKGRVIGHEYRKFQCLDCGAWSKGPNVAVQNKVVIKSLS